MTTTVEKDFKIDSKEILPPPDFLYDDNASNGGHYLARSAVITSLPWTIKWLRDCVKEHPSTRLQVTITWMVLALDSQFLTDLANGWILLTWC